MTQKAQTIRENMGKFNYIKIKNIQSKRHFKQVHQICYILENIKTKRIFIIYKELLQVITIRQPIQQKYEKQIQRRKQQQSVKTSTLLLTSKIQNEKKYNVSNISSRIQSSGNSNRLGEYGVLLLRSTDYVIQNRVAGFKFWL